MPKRTSEERIAEYEGRIRQLQVRKQQLEQQAKEKARKERTRTLIQIGAVMANLGVTTVQEAQRLQAWFLANPRRLSQLHAITHGAGLDGLMQSEPLGGVAPAPPPSPGGSLPV